MQINKSARDLYNKKQSTVQPPFNTPHYNIALDIAQSCCGSHFFTMKFYKVIIGK